MDNKHRAANTHKQVGGSSHTEGAKKDGRILSMGKKANDKHKSLN
jgi:hypothetical protein